MQETPFPSRSKCRSSFFIGIAAKTLNRLQLRICYDIILLVRTFYLIERKEMIMKRALSLLVVLIVLLSLCACSKSETQNTDPNTNPSQSTTDNTEEPSTCQHSYTNVTCTTPKICTKCNKIAGNALPHSYKNGKCSVCGRAEILETFKAGDWVAHTVKAGTGNQGTILSEYILNSTQRRYSNVVCYSNASACIIGYGKVIYNEKTYYADWYPTTYLPVTWEENGDTITVTIQVDNHDACVFVMTKTSETQLTVISSTNTERVPVGVVFNKV